MKTETSRRERRWFALILYVAGLFPAGTALSRDICWIEAVTKTPSGVELRLFQSAYAVLFSPGQPPREMHVIVTSPSDLRDKVQPIPVVSSINAKLGDEIRLSGFAHDSCRLQVVTTDNRIGVLVHFSNTTPGMPAQSGSKFVAAQ